MMSLRIVRSAGSSPIPSFYTNLGPFDTGFSKSQTQRCPPYRIVVFQLEDESISVAGFGRKND